MGCEDEHLRPEEVIRVHFREMGGEAMDASPSVDFCVSAVKMSMRRLGSGKPDQDICKPGGRLHANDAEAVQRLRREKLASMPS